MIIKPGLAAIAAACSAVLILGNTAHAREYMILGYAPGYKTVEQITAQASQIEVTVDMTDPTPLKDDSSLLASSMVEKLEKLEAPQAIAEYSSVALPSTVQIASSDGSNSYTWGQCTWYAKSKRPDLPNNLGNGGQWVANAAARGFATGSTPRAGAIGEQPGHVVYIESVNSDGTVNISEMNYNGGVGVVNYRTVAASTFTYIY